MASQHRSYQQALGHADVEMALHYVHMSDQQAREALEGVGRKILGTLNIRE